MDTPKTSTEEKKLWEEFRDTVRGGVRDLKNIGDELARQGRLRMDIHQTDRRLKSAYEELGRVTYTRFGEARPVSTEDPMIAELNVRIGYYLGEMHRLQDEIQGGPTSQN